MSNYKTERDVEVNLINKLFKDILLYPESCLSWDYPVKMNFGREKKIKYADLVVTHSEHKKPLIVVEAKKPTETIQSGISQVDSYAFFLESRYSVLTNGKAFVLRGYYGNSKVNIIESNIDELDSSNWNRVRQLISYYEVLNSLSLRANQSTEVNYEKIKDYRRYFRNIHNIIRDGDKLDPGASFDEFSKILCLKFYQEEWILKNLNNPLNLNKLIEEQNYLEQGGISYINKWFKKSIEENYSEIFDADSKINLSFETFYAVWERLENFQLKTDIDIKGRAFEEFLPTQLRGKGLGQFFTPRSIVNFMTNLADISIYDIVGDFACGSGGFLIKAFERMIDLTNQMPSGMWSKIGVSKNEFIEILKTEQIFGIDAEPRAARTAKINMMMWGDGKRIVRGNSLDTKDEDGKEYFLKEYNSNDKSSGCTVILANPPFGSKEKKESILKNYILGSKLVKRKSQRTEILFLEKGLKLLKPEGKMLIVIPSGILSNESYKYVRDYLHSEAEIRAIIDLPTHTFVQSGVPTIKTSILYLQKFTSEKKKKYDEEFISVKSSDIIKEYEEFNYSIFMGKAEYIGFEPNGRIINDGLDTDLDLLIKDYNNRSDIDNKLINLIDFSSKYYRDKESFRIDNSNIRGKNRNLKNSFIIDFKDIESRLDTSYYFFKNNSQNLLNKFESLENKIIDRSQRFLPKTDEELDIEYRILSVTNNEGVIFNEFRKGEEFTSAYKVVKKGNIVYNPYRINVGSIGIVTDELDNSYVSPAYIVFDIIGMDSEFFIQLIKSPFYKMYIDIVTTGSIRDNLSLDLLKKLKFPKINKNGQKEILDEVLNLTSKQKKLRNNINHNKDKIMEKLHSILIS
ncbi:hypothetical protein GCM10007424_16800 [Flavobacterium suaedae]|uniref:Site-specific DNA-methyltransferase (adenine-specific) n=1 Tax=Flavobacterium suaedae TaxID=1767027 RepID=A0ABQ1JXI4_9FLAO|nr:N-6 DNA methylase [Flavobacterium suaedae]GGB77388.1 hypothetical protein GCM10007424_16800 [Flavobacterium suaedae]